MFRRTSHRDSYVLGRPAIWVMTSMAQSPSRTHQKPHAPRRIELARNRCCTPRHPQLRCPFQWLQRNGGTSKAGARRKSGRDGRDPHQLPRAERTRRRHRMPSWCTLRSPMAQTPSKDQCNFHLPIRADGFDTEAQTKRRRCTQRRSSANGFPELASIMRLGHGFPPQLQSSPQIR